LVVNGNLLVTITSTVGDGLIMTNAADEVIINGDAVFTHANNNDQATSVGNFTNGVLKFRGHFTQSNGTNSGTRPIFTATGTKVVFDGANNQNVHFSDVGAAFSRFQDLDIDNTAGVTFTTSAVASGTVTILNGIVTSTTGTVTIGDDLIDAVGGRWQALNITFSGPIVSLPATLMTNATFTGGGLLENGFNLTGNLSVAAGGRMEVNSHTVSTSGDLTVTISNTVGDGLIMTNAADDVIINGDAIFTHASNNDQATSLNNYTAGLIRLRGHFTQTNGTNSGTRPIFTSTGTKVILDGPGIQNVSFSDPGPGFSRIHDLDIENATGVTFNTDAYITRQLTLGANAVLNQGAGEHLFFTARMPVVAAGTYNVVNTRVLGTITMTADLVMPLTLNDLIIEPNKKLIVGGRNFTLGGDLLVTITDNVGDGLIMTDPSDNVTIEGDATFSHSNNNDQATSVGNFTDGLLKFRGQFTQTNGTNSGTRLFLPLQVPG
jgi:hypothetical protein